MLLTIAYSVSEFLHAPTADHFLAVKRILRYVKGTLHFGLTFRPSTVPSTLVAYSDVDWAGCPDTRRSTSCYSIYLGNNFVSWSAKKKPVVSRSSCESEYRALATTAAELLWVTHLLHDLQIPVSQQPLLLYDNNSAIFFLALILFLQVATSSHKVFLDLSLNFSDPSFTFVQIPRSACYITAYHICPLIKGKYIVFIYYSLYIIYNLPYFSVL